MFCRLLTALAVLVSMLPFTSPAGEIVDTLVFGDAASETAHVLTGTASETLTGLLGEPARRLLPLAPQEWRGGSVFFSLAVDPVKQNFVTVRLSGDEAAEGVHILFCDGLQIGCRHLGDVEVLDLGADEKVLNGRFYYRTMPLPAALTRGKTKVACEIQATGRIWSYGAKFDDYQKAMTHPGRGLYRLYSHTDGWFVPPPGEKQGAAPVSPPVREKPGAEVLDEVKVRVNRELKGILADRRPPGQLAMHLLARAWFVKWTAAAENPKVIEREVAGLDELFRRWKKDAKVAQSDPGVYNSDWFGLGLAGDVVRLLAAQLAGRMDEEMDDGAGGKLRRRDGWAAMLVESRDWLRAHRRQYTNQAMIVDMNIYRANRGIAVLDAKAALPEAEALRYLHEAAGLRPWLGSETPDGPAAPLGRDYWQLTKKGLTRELGFVGYYGEVLDWMEAMYDSTRMPGGAGDPSLKAQMEKAARARAHFRFPSVDEDGCRAMRAETVVGWRDVHLPGDVTYGQRPTWDALPLSVAATTRDPALLGAARQMLEDHQFFPVVGAKLKEGGLRTTAALLNVPDDYAAVMAAAPGLQRLPMSPGQPDFAWADEEDGVVAVKHGEEIFYASLYWRSRHAVNSLARIHHMTPGFSRMAVVPVQVEFDASGQTWKRPDWVNFGFANGGMGYPDKRHSALAGEVLPIAKVPEGVAWKPGQENIHAGRGTFYTLHTGPWIIAMNFTADRTFSLPPQPDGGRAFECISGKEVSLEAPTKVPPHSTVVLRLR